MTPCIATKWTETERSAGFPTAEAAFYEDRSRCKSPHYSSTYCDSKSQNRLYASGSWDTPEYSQINAALSQGVTTVCYKHRDGLRSPLVRINNIAPYTTRYTASGTCVMTTPGGCIIYPCTYDGQELRSQLVVGLAPRHTPTTRHSRVMSADAQAPDGT